jgi:hypothetical protein
LLTRRAKLVCNFNFNRRQRTWQKKINLKHPQHRLRLVLLPPVLAVVANVAVVSVVVVAVVVVAAASVVVAVAAVPVPVGKAKWAATASR